MLFDRNFDCLCHEEDDESEEYGIAYYTEEDALEAVRFALDTGTAQQLETGKWYTACDGGYVRWESTTTEQIQNIRIYDDFAIMQNDVN